jgi:hypothetical protein
MTPCILGGIAVLGLLLFVLGVVICRSARSPDAAGFGLFVRLAGMAVCLLDLLALLIWLAVT